MRIYHSQLSNQLHKTLLPTYLVFGDEPWQKNDALAQIKSTAKAQGYDELIRFTVEPSFNFSDILNEINSMSLFSSLRIIEVDMVTAKVDQASAQILQQIAELQSQGQSDVLLILHGQKLDAATTNKKWFKSLSQHGCYLPLYELEGKGLTIWLSQQCQRLRLNMSQQAQQLLIDFYAGNTPALAQELEKLQLLYDSQHIDAPLLETLLTKQSKFTPFQLTDALLGGNLHHIMDMLTQMKHEGIAAGQLVWVIHSQLAQLEKMHLQHRQGQSLEQLFKQFKVWDKKKPLYQNALRSISLSNVQRAKKRLAQVDLISKTASDFDAFILLSDVCVSLYQGETLRALSLDYES
ncbi:DNA polymerase III subunit delta [Thalassotalea ponticola]|uniref:DNA polymerase III subunit delta n=1 Tax=Thalassotalea ponticola TaxID=1523392 RepID=UPI0025B2CD45|nr:DNA polymerase III subunit delta [Thalassotalea ponticola]MDN3652565.1 DNA polymerase III subunit delta [Thalassotalea ponticola]